MKYILRYNRIIDAANNDVDNLNYEEAYVCPARMLSVDQMHEFLHDLSLRVYEITDELKKEVCDRYRLNPDDYETFDDLYDAIKPF